MKVLKMAICVSREGREGGGGERVQGGRQLVEGDSLLTLPSSSHSRNAHIKSHQSHHSHHCHHSWHSKHFDHYLHPFHHPLISICLMSHQYSFGNTDHHYHCFIFSFISFIIIESFISLLVSSLSSTSQYLIPGATELPWAWWGSSGEFSHLTLLSSWKFYLGEVPLVSFSHLKKKLLSL